MWSVAWSSTVCPSCPALRWRVGWSRERTLSVSCYSLDRMEGTLLYSLFSFQRLTSRAGERGDLVPKE